MLMPWHRQVGLHRRRDHAGDDRQREERQGKPSLMPPRECPRPGIALETKPTNAERRVAGDDRHPSQETEGTEGVERSEEHTSELQSPCNLVCRLLLEKKKK